MPNTQSQTVVRAREILALTLAKVYFGPRRYETWGRSTWSS